MATAIIMPKFEMAQETGTIARWIRGEGDPVDKGDVLLEVETDKVTMEVESPAQGILVNISAAPGEVVPIGRPIAYVVKPGEVAPGAPAAPAAAAPQGAGDPPEKRSLSPAQRESPSKGAFRAGRPQEGAPRVTPLAQRMAADQGVDLAGIAGSGPQGRITKEDVEAAAARQAVAGLPEGKVRAVPAARRLARELGVDLPLVSGSGPGGRIQSHDVARFAERAQAVGAAPAPEVLVGPQREAPETGPVRAEYSAGAPIPGRPAVRRIVPLSSIRRTIAERMTQSVRDAPQFTVTADVDMTRAMVMVEDLKFGAEDNSPKVTLTAFLVMACARALARYPAANAAFEDGAAGDGGQIAEWDEVNVGVAVATGQGLVVPVIRGADRLGAREIAASLADLSARARDGKLRLEDVQGGTFTLSNLGMFGIDRFTAILNPPQAAILAAGRVARRPVVDDDGQIKAAPMASLTVTADHRVLDGAAAAQFLALIQKMLEHPGILLG